MKSKFYTRGLAALFVGYGMSVSAQTDPAAQISAVCTSQAIASSPNVAAACEQTMLGVLNALAQSIQTETATAALSAAATAQTKATTQRTAELTIQKAVLDNLKAAVGPIDAATLTALKSTITSGETSAKPYTTKYLLSAAAIKASQSAAVEVAAAATDRGAKRCSAIDAKQKVAVALINEPLSSAFANYSIARDAIDVLIAEAEELSGKAADIPLPPGMNTTPGNVTNQDKRRLFSLETIVAVSAGIDIVAKASALIASFRPAFKYETADDDDYSAFVETAFRSQLIKTLQDIPLIAVSASLPTLTSTAPPTSDMSMRRRLSELMQKAKELSTTKSDAKVARIDALQKATQDLVYRLLIAQPAADGKTNPPIIQSLDQIDAANLPTKCVLSLRTKTIAAGQDSYREQRAFGTEVNRLLVFGSATWELTSPDGEIVGAGFIQTESTWHKYGE